MVLDMEDLAQRLGPKSGAPQSRGIAQDWDKQQSAGRSKRGHRAGNCTTRREKEHESRRRTECTRQVTLALEAALTSVKSGSELLYEVTLRLQR